MAMYIIHSFTRYPDPRLTPSRRIVITKVFAIARSKIMSHIILKGHKIIENVYHEQTTNLHTQEDLHYISSFFFAPTGNKTSILKYLLNVLKCVYDEGSMRIPMLSADR